MSHGTQSHSDSLPPALGKPFPFTEIQGLAENVVVRTFSADVDPMELQWHWDEEHRIVTAEHDSDWRIQLDNHLPMDLPAGVSTFIPAGTWHRVIKGTGDLTVTIVKS